VTASCPGFKSYCSFPVYLEHGSFFGTLCALDPAPRRVADEAISHVHQLREGGRRDPVGRHAGRPRDGLTPSRR
jgi:hypothetical protein